MPLVLDLRPELENRLKEEANRQGVSPDAWTVRLLENHFADAERRKAGVELLQKWIDEDDTDAVDESDEDFLRAIDEHRSSDRKLYPPELKGITW